MTETQAEKANALLKVLSSYDSRALKLDKDDESRSLIANLVIITYVVVTLAIFVFVILLFWFDTPCQTGQETVCTDWQPAGEFLLKVLTSAVLPIVTLVLGYYFGVAKQKRNRSSAGGK